MTKVCLRNWTESHYLIDVFAIARNYCGAALIKSQGSVVCPRQFLGNFSSDDENFRGSKREREREREIESSSVGNDEGSGIIQRGFVLSKLARLFHVTYLIGTVRLNQCLTLRRSVTCTLARISNEELPITRRYTEIPRRFRRSRRLHPSEALPRRDKAGEFT